MKDKRIRKFNEFLLLYILLGQSNMPFLMGDVFLIIGFLYSLFIFTYRRLNIDQKVLQFSFVFLLLFIIQIFTSQNFMPTILIAFMLRIYFAYFVIRILGENFVSYFVKMIFFFTVVSLIVYVPLLLFKNFEGILTSYITPIFSKITYYKDSPHFILFTMNIDSNSGFPRNPGPFWEAGGFGIFLNLALICNLIITKKIFEKKNIIFLLAIITTQSTGSYLTTFFILISFLAYSRRISYFIIFIPLLLYVGFVAYNELPFLQDKVGIEIGFAMNNDYKQSPHTRLVSARIDWDDFVAHPLTGKGRYGKVSTDVNEFHSSEEYRNNGTTLLLAQFGLIGFLLYSYYLLKSFKKLCSVSSFSINYAYIVVLSLWLAGFSQTIFTKPFFFALCFLFCGFPVSRLLKGESQNLSAEKI
jgi:hypothetical protein